MYEILLNSMFLLKFFSEWAVHICLVCVCVLRHSVLSLCDPMEPTSLFCPWNWQVDFLPLHHLGSPTYLPRYDIIIYPFDKNILCSFYITQLPTTKEWHMSLLWLKAWLAFQHCLSSIKILEEYIYMAY